MEETLFPPSPNWFLPNVLDVACDGSVCYGANTSLVLMNVTDNGNDKKLKVDKLEIIPHVHRERISVVAFGPPGGYGKMIATIGGDGYVKVWDSVTGVMSQVHQSHGAAAKLRGMDWSSANRQLIVSVDESGVLVLFDVGANKSDKLVFPKLHATILACCPHKWQWVAVGDASGLVLIVSISGTGSVIRKMRGHDNAVMSLSWSPVTGNPFVNATNRSRESSELLLASGAGARSVIIWRAGSDGQCQMEMLPPTAPPGPPKSRNAGTSLVGQGNLTAVCWASRYTLLSSTMWGELLCWNLAELATWQQANGKTMFNAHRNTLGRTTLTRTHQQSIFSISCKKIFPPVAPESSAIDWRQKEQPAEEPRVLVWTTSKDRLLVATETGVTESRLALPTLGGFVYCMAASKLDCHKVAIGAGDGTIRVWNMANVTNIELRSLWLKIKGRVTTLVWHPTHDSWLAYGTSEGRVGVYDMANPGRGPIFMWSFHRKSVYSLGWGPGVSKRGTSRTSDQKHFLYSCGDNMLLCYNLQKTEEAFADVQTSCYLKGEPLALHVTEFSWKADYSMVAIGTDTGCVHLCTAPNLDIQATVYPHKKMIQSLAWHPMATTTEPTGSPLCHLLAFASTENTVKIFNFEHLFSKEPSVDGAGSFTTISGHLERVTQIAWSPHIGGLLATASYDGSSQIWDVRGGRVTLLALYPGHNGWVVSVTWCPMDSDFVITGSSDFTLRVWRVSSQGTERRVKPLNVLPPVTDPALAVVRSKGKKPTQPIVEAQVEGATTAAGRAGLKKSHFPVSSRVRNLGKDSLRASTYALLRNRTKVVTDEEKEESLIGSGELVHLGFFTDKAAMERMLDVEEKQLLELNLPGPAQNVNLWRSNDLTATLEKAISEKKVTLWHISIAPMVSSRLWRDLVYTYAEQLRDEGRLQDAATMLTVIREVLEAIEMLISGGLYREAVCIARCHLPEDTELRIRILTEWAKHAEFVGDYELAVQSYISVGNFDQAARTQGFRKDPKSLELAVALAEASGNYSLISTLAGQAIQRNVVEQSYKQAQALVDRLNGFVLWSWLIITHEQMMKNLESLRKSAFEAQRIDHWLNEKESCAAVIDGIVGLCKEKVGETSADASCILCSIDGNPKAKNEVLLSVAAHVAASLSTKTDQSKEVYLVKAFEVCYRYHTVFTRSRLLLAAIIFVTPSPNMERLDNPTGPNISIEAFMCAGLVRWMDQECSSTPSKDDEDTTTILGKILATIKFILPSALDTRALFYSNAVSQYAKYEKMILAPKLAYGTETATIESSENGLDRTSEEVSVENGFSELSLNGSSKAELEDESQISPALTLLRLKKFESYFEKTRVAAPNPYALYLDLVRVLTQYKEREVVQELLGYLETAWKKREAAISEIWTKVLQQPDDLFDEQNDVIAHFWDSEQNRNQSADF